MTTTLATYDPAIELHPAVYAPVVDDELWKQHGTPTPDGLVEFMETPKARPGNCTRHHRFHDRDLREMARVARYLDSVMIGPIYDAGTGLTSFTANSGGAAATVVGVANVAGTDFAIIMYGYTLGFLANSAQTGVPVAYGACTFATNPPGTNSTSVTPQRRSGSALALTNITAGVNWTTQPTVKTLYAATPPSQPFAGPVLEVFQTGQEPDSEALGSGMYVDIFNSTGSLSMTCDMRFGRC